MQDRGTETMKLVKDSSPRDRAIDSRQGARQEIYKAVTETWERTSNEDLRDVNEESNLVMTCMRTMNRMTSTVKKVRKRQHYVPSPIGPESLTTAEISCLKHWI